MTERRVVAQNWYSNEKFPLIPLLRIKKGDKYNTNNFTFKWLFFTIWSLDSFCFEASLNIDTHWGIGFTGLLPYLRIIVAIPCPDKIGFWIDKHLNRHPDFNKYNNDY